MRVPASIVLVSAPPDIVLLGAIFLAILVVLIAQLRVLTAVSEPETERKINQDHLSAVFHRTLSELGLQDSAVRIEGHARRMETFHEDVVKLLRVPQTRGAFGEQQLDVLLSEHLPPEMYGLREQVVNGKAPDANIRSSQGTICVDSKFPLDNYERYVEAANESEREHHAAQFARDVESQLEKIATDYVRPSAGTTDFAFAFIPAESVYYHLVSQEYHLLRKFTMRGVQVVSPLTFGQKLELIKADVRTRQLSSEAESIAEDLKRLRDNFEDFESEWKTLRGHLRNAGNKAEDVERRYSALRTEFDRIDRPLESNE